MITRIISRRASNCSSMPQRYHPRTRIEIKDYAFYVLQPCTCRVSGGLNMSWIRVIHLNDSQHAGRPSIFPNHLSNLDQRAHQGELLHVVGISLSLMRIRKGKKHNLPRRRILHIKGQTSSAVMPQRYRPRSRMSTQNNALRILQS